MLSIFMSTASYNNPIVSSHAMHYYNLVLNDDFESITDIDSYYKWTNSLTSLFYFRNEADHILQEEPEILLDPKWF